MVFKIFLFSIQNSNLGQFSIFWQYLEGLAGMTSRVLAANFLHMAIFLYGLSIYSSLDQKKTTRDHAMPLSDIFFLNRAQKSESI
jgi:hypothetical protein